MILLALIFAAYGPGAFDALYLSFRDGARRAYQFLKRRFNA